MKQWLRSLRSFGGERSRRIASIVVVFGLAAALVSPTNLSAAPFTFGIGEEAQSTNPGSVDADLLLVHCCHSHPYAPYDNYCCHEPRVGSAVVGGAIAYGTYRGVKSARKHYKKHHKNKPKPRRRR